MTGLLLALAGTFAAALPLAAAEPARKWWAENSARWAEVRGAWAEVYSKREVLDLSPRPGESRLWEELNALAEKGGPGIKEKAVQLIESRAGGDSMTLTTLAVLSAGLVWGQAGALWGAPVRAAAPAQVRAVPPLTALLAAPPSPSNMAKAPEPAKTDKRMSVEVKRDETLARLAETPLASVLDAGGLRLWHVLRYSPRSGEQVHLTLGLPYDKDGKEDFGPGRETEGRKAELSRRLAGVSERVSKLVAEALGMDPDRVVLHERLLEACCGAGCTTCLLTKPEHARRWTGRDPRPGRD